jgi:uncharacterized membrane protein
MNAAHLHLILNHYPVVGLSFAFIILIVGMYFHSEVSFRVGSLVAALSGLLTIPTYLAGEAAEEIVEKLPGIESSIIESHEKAAGFALGFMVWTAILATVALWLSWKKGRTPKPLAWGLLFFVAFTLTVLTMTANWGGKIHHQEIRSQNTPTL